MMLLKVTDVSKSYGGVEALKGVSLQVSAGEAVGVAGDNGAGKSTLMKIIAGAIKADGGSITFDSIDITHANPAAKRQAGIEMIYQDLGICKQHNAVANIFLGRELKAFGFWLNMKAMKKQSKTILADLNASLPLDKEVGMLSGGQQQVVAIARSMQSNPKLVIMDEPTAALGVKEAQNVLDVICSLKQRGIAIILISHRLTDIIETTDRILLLKHGVLSEELKTKDITLKKLIEKMQD